jgi:hypothetical protein
MGHLKVSTDVYFKKEMVNKVNFKYLDTLIN